MTKRQEEYHFFKDIGICVRCHKQRAEPNRVLCWQCADTDLEYCRLSRKRNQNKERQRDLDKYYMLKEKGICTYCKHEKAVSGKTKCAKCLAKIRNKRNQNRDDIDRSERVSHGICYVCGKDKTISGKGVCEKCYETRIQSISKIMYLPGDPRWKNDNKLIFCKGK